MSSLDFLQTRTLASSGVTLQSGTDTSVAIRVRKIGSETATSVTVTTATNIVFVGSTTTDTLAFATYTTLGAVVDAINATGRWEAKILDALRSQASVSTILTGAVTAGADGNGTVVYDIMNDTSTALEVAVCLSPKRDFDAPKGHRVHIQQVVYAVNMGTAAVDSFQIYKRKGLIETKLFGALSVDTTETTLNLASGFGKISAGTDEELIVRVKDAATLADATSNFVRVVGIIE